jgi:Zn-finger nucleic acid-binding protein
MYRDEREVCPRCAGDLIEAGAGRACVACAGLWISAQVVQDMATTMQTPLAPVELPWEEQQRAALSCPTCTTPMRTLALYGVPVELCVKNHGVWFDAQELALVLLRSANRPG